VANVDIDALACFDMMIESCQNLSCRSHGADPRYLKLHGQMHRHTRYYPKHSFGVSTQYNQHSDKHPWYGAGQGTSDAAIRWTLISHSLISAYQSEATPWRLKSTIRDVLITLGIDAFVDNTNMIHGDDGDADIAEILQIVQNNFQIWQGLLHASGGVLNIPKCSWTPFTWKYNNFGHASLTTLPPDTNVQLHASDLKGTQHTIWINKPADAVHLLGVHITADGNYDKELCVLKQKQQKYVQFLLCTPLTKQEAQVIYKQCYLPTVTYPLPATNMPPSKIYDTQCSVTSLFLTRMGYPRHLPCCVVYTPEMVGGLGMCHLGHEQGVQQTLQLLRHLRANSTNGKLYSLTINQYQIYAGTQQPVLEHTKAIGWMPKGWISSIQEFLHFTNSQIILQCPWTPTNQRTHDRCIMDNAMQQFLDTHLETINSVCMYLRIFMLSDITKSNGKMLMPSVIDGSAKPITSPLKKTPQFIVLSLGPTVVNLKTHTVNVIGYTKLTDRGTLRVRNRAVHNTYTIIQSAVTFLRGAM